MKIAIIDDEKNIILQIRNLLEKQYHSEIEISEFTSGEKFLHTDTVFDIVFLDIELEKMNGISIAKKLRKKEKSILKKEIIIFVTGYEKYMPQAFDVNAFHFIVKPIEGNRFVSIVERAMEECRQGNAKLGEAIMIKMNGISKKIFLRDILYLDCYNKKVTIHTVDGEEWCYLRMGELEKLLGNSFYRCHRSFIINFMYVKEYDALHIFLSDKTEIPMAKPKYHEFVKAYLHYAKKGGIVNV